MKLPAMQVKVYAPFQVYFDGLAESLSATNETGPFDILPHHKNFMSLLKPGNITVRQQGKPDFSLQVDRAVVHVRANKVTVFLDV
ncbi:MAG TPA: F0F1 ATP synthase subunit epsilon [Candidatus Saccharimonadales bacterium]|nr:F0F1 ATP synthase subunit epsilon [Candidatus Saccharimonadales bacterium]